MKKAFDYYKTPLYVGDYVLFRIDGCGHTDIMGNISSIFDCTDKDIIKDNLLVNIRHGNVFYTRYGFQVEKISDKKAMVRLLEQ